MIFFFLSQFKKFLIVLFIRDLSVLVSFLIRKVSVFVEIGDSAGDLLIVAEVRRALTFELRRVGGILVNKLVNRWI